MIVAATVLSPSHRHGPLARAKGLLLCALIAAGAILLGGQPFFATHGFSALTLAIVIGMTLGNTAYPVIAPACESGVGFCKQTLLRSGVVLYGLRLTVQDIERVGVAGVLVDMAMVASTFWIATWLGTRWLGVDRKTAMLIGAGSAICGAAAVMATEPVVRARAEHVTVAVATVVAFGTAAIFIYPLLFDLNTAWQVLPDGDSGFGVYAGSSIHEVAQVIAATRALGADVVDTAVITKMVRVMLLAPFLLVLSLRLARDSDCDSPSDRLAVSAWRAVPLFAVGFIGVVLFNSLHLLPRAAVDAALFLDTLVLAMAMAALGLSTRTAAVREAGAKPLLLAALVAVWLIAGGALVSASIGGLLRAFA